MTACVRTPKRDSYGETACKILFLHGPLTLDEAIAIHGNFGSTRSDTHDVYRKSVMYDFIFESRNKYFLAPYLHAHIKKIVEGDTTKSASKPQLVPKRGNMSRGEMPVQKRDPRIREIYFKVG